jgi:hypothetical protein
MQLALQTEYRLDGFIINLLSAEADIEDHLDWEWDAHLAYPKNDEFTKDHHDEALKAINKILEMDGFRTVQPLTSDDLTIDIADIEIVKVGA